MSATKCILMMSVVMALAAQAHGATKSLQFTGSVTHVPASLASQFSVGQPISGSYTFDLLVADADPRSETARYLFSVAPFNVSIGSYALTGLMQGDIEVTDGILDSYTVVSVSSGTPVSGVSPVLQAVQLEDPTGTIFGSTVMPEALDASRFAARNFTLDFDNGARLIGQVNAFVVPEPAASGGLLIAIGLLARRTRRSLVAAERVVTTTNPTLEDSMAEGKIVQPSDIHPAEHRD